MLETNSTGLRYDNATDTINTQENMKLNTEEYITQTDPYKRENFDYNKIQQILNDIYNAENHNINNGASDYRKIKTNSNDYNAIRKKSTRENTKTNSFIYSKSSSDCRSKLVKQENKYNSNKITRRKDESHKAFKIDLREVLKTVAQEEKTKLLKSDENIKIEKKEKYKDNNEESRTINDKTDLIRNLPLSINNSSITNVYNINPSPLSISPDFRKNFLQQQIKKQIVEKPSLLNTTDKSNKVHYKYLQICDLLNSLEKKNYKIKEQQKSEKTDNLVLYNTEKIKKIENMYNFFKTKSNGSYAMKVSNSNSRLNTLINKKVEILPDKCKDSTYNNSIQWLKEKEKNRSVLKHKITEENKITDETERLLKSFRKVSENMQTERFNLMDEISISSDILEELINNDLVKKENKKTKNKISRNKNEKIFRDSFQIDRTAKKSISTKILNTGQENFRMSEVKQQSLDFEETGTPSETKKNLFEKNTMSFGKRMKELMKQNNSELDTILLEKKNKFDSESCTISEKAKTIMARHNIKNNI